MLGAADVWFDHHHIGSAPAGEPLDFTEPRACPSPAPRRRCSAQGSPAGGGHGTPTSLFSVAAAGQHRPKWVPGQPATVRGWWFCRAEPRHPPARGMDQGLRRQRQPAAGRPPGVSSNDPGSSPPASFGLAPACHQGRPGPQSRCASTRRCGHRSDPPPGNKAMAGLPGCGCRARPAPSSGFEVGPLHRRSEHPEAFELTIAASLSAGRFRCFEHGSLPLSPQGRCVPGFAPLGRPVRSPVD